MYSITWHARIGAAVDGILRAAVGMVQVCVDCENVADEPRARLLDGPLDGAVRAEHVARLKRDVPGAADVADLLEARERSPQGLVHVHRVAALRALHRHLHEFGVRDLDDDQVRLHLLEDLAGRVAGHARVELPVRLDHAHRGRRGVVHPADDLVVVLEPTHRVPLSARVVVDDAPQDGTDLPVRRRLPPRTRLRRLPRRHRGQIRRFGGRFHLQGAPSGGTRQDQRDRAHCKTVPHPVLHRHSSVSRHSASFKADGSLADGLRNESAPGQSSFGPKPEYIMFRHSTSPQPS